MAKQKSKQVDNKVLAQEAAELANDLAHGHYSMADAIVMLRKCAAALRRGN